MIKDFQTYINEGLFDRNQSEFVIKKTNKGIEQVYIPKTKDDLYKYIEIDIEQATKDRTYPNVNLNNIDISELEDDALDGLFSENAYTINPDISDWNIKYIPQKIFDGNKKIDKFTIPNGVISIGAGAFQYCSGLKSVTIPNSVTSIGILAFYGCNNLTKTNYTGDIAGWCSINFGRWGSNPTAYSHNLYINDVAVKDLMIPNSVTSIGSSAFEGCSGLTSVTIGNSVTSIGESAFDKCSGLTSVTIPNSITSIEGSTFYGCSALTSVTIPNSVTIIGGHAFEGCSRLTSVTIPNSVTIIGGYAFDGCSSLTSVTIGNSVTSIGKDAFWGCSSLTSVTIPNSVTSIGDYAFEGCSILTSVTIPNSVTNIGDYAFRGCSDLKDVTISKHCRIYTYSFPENCKIILRDD